MIHDPRSQYIPILWPSQRGVCCWLCMAGFDARFKSLEKAWSITKSEAETKRPIKGR